MFFDFDRAAAANSSEDTLLMRELCRRTAGEVAAATAAIALVNSAGSATTRRQQVDHALARLQGFGELNRLLARPLPARAELAELLEAVCAAVAHGVRGSPATRINLDLREAWVTGAAARRLLVVASGLIGEAMSSAFRGRVGWVRVALRADGDEVALTVEDQGPGPRLPGRGPERGGGLDIAADLVGRGDGTMTVVTGRRGTRMIITMPTGLQIDDGDVPF